MDGRHLPRVILTCTVLTMCGLAATGEAHAQRTGPSEGVTPRGTAPPWQHDRAFIPPGLLPNPPGRGNPSNLQQAAATVMAALDGTVVAGPEPVAATGGITGSRTAGGAFVAPVRAAILALVVDGDASQTQLLGARLAQGNAGGAREAQALAVSLQALAGEPERLRETVVRFNALIDASDAAWLAEPPVEVLAVRAVLLALVEAAELAAKEAEQTDAQLRGNRP